MEPIEFNRAEQYILQYYRDPSNCRFFRYVASNLYYLVPSAVLAGISLWQDSAAWTFVAYGLLAVYVCHNLVKSREYLNVVPSILTKYEARVEALEKQLADLERKD